MITLAQLSEIERSCDGVTAGPWYFEISGEVSAPSPYRKMGRSFTGIFTSPSDGPHIARLDPATVRELVRLARIGLERVTLPDSTNQAG